MTKKAERDAFVDDLLADPESYRKRWDDALRRDRPEMTDEQVKASWEQVVHQIGL
jgi:hypothetical protein